jgi:pimeloyl-ACP methyl ester carboxylesterase
MWLFQVPGVAEAVLAAGSRVEIVPGAGHFMHRERPDEIAALCLDWFRD